MDSLKAEVARREKYAEGLERQIADLSAEVERLRAGRSGSKEGENSESVEAPAAVAEDLEGMHNQIEALNGELERVGQKRKWSSDVVSATPDVRVQVEVWLQCRSDEHQKQIFSNSTPLPTGRWQSAISPAAWLTWGSKPWARVTGWMKWQATAPSRLKSFGA